MPPLETKKAMQTANDTNAAITPPAHDVLRDILRSMVRIRRFEEALVKLFKRGKLPGFVHLYIGEEAVAVGVCSALRSADRITSTHRGHGHLLAKGADVKAMMAELFGKETGLCRGKGGSMHSVDFSLGIIGTNGIVGGGIPIATGAAWGDKQLGRDLVSVAFFGDGASNQGVFFESMNLAAKWRLPVIFLCENNGYTEWTPTEQLTSGGIVDRAAPFGFPGEQVDGNDVLQVREAVQRAVARGRAGEGPTLIECRTYRWHGHNEGEEAFSGEYRAPDEIARWKEQDPIVRFTKKVKELGAATDEQITAIDAEETQLAADAVAFAENSPYPDPEEALMHAFSDGPVVSGRIS
jgi:pyruvate dehydrogenase E1 component alpha subunit